MGLMLSCMRAEEVVLCTSSMKPSLTSSNSHIHVLLRPRILAVDPLASCGFWVAGPFMVAARFVSRHCLLHGLFYSLWMILGPCPVDVTLFMVVALSM
jgi:hypothetical protein